MMKGEMRVYTELERSYLKCLSLIYVKKKRHTKGSNVSLYCLKTKKDAKRKKVSSCAFSLFFISRWKPHAVRCVSLLWGCRCLLRRVSYGVII